MNKQAKIAVSVVSTVLAVILSFTAGFFVSRCSFDKTVSSYRWAIETIEENYYFCEPDQTFTETSLKAIAYTYLDRYSEYYTKEEYAEVLKSNEGSKSGIGIGYSYVSGKGVFISRVVGNSPAYRSGLRPGEIIKSGKTEGGNEVEFTSLNAFTDLVTPAKDGEKITLVAVDGARYTVAKAEYTASYASISFSDTGWQFCDSADGGLALYEETSLRIASLPQDCAYLKFDQFYGSAANEFYSLVEKFNARNCTSLILDLRSNGGGYVSVMQEVAGSFADGSSKLAMLSRDKKGKEEKFNCKKVSDANRRIGKDKKVFVLANAGTASASEALIGAMVCYGALSYENIFLSQYSDGYINWLYPNGGEVKNAQTFGKGIMQTPFTNFSTGEVLKLTTAKIFWPDKTTSIHDRGVTLEDGATPVKTDFEWTKGDKELLSAIEIIKTRL